MKDDSKIMAIRLDDGLRFRHAAVKLLRNQREVL